MGNPLFPAGAVAVVTGGSRGIGGAVARDLAAEGATVIVNYATGEAAADATVAAIWDAGGSARAFPADVTDEAAVRSMFDAVRREFGRLDVLVTCAAIMLDAPVLQMPLGDFEQVMRVNMNGVFLCCRESARLMIAARRGSIVNLSSTTSQGGPGTANYAASKGAITSFTRSIAAELAPYGVRANVVSPGLIDAGLSLGMRPDVRKAVMEHIPLDRAGHPEEVARTVSFLASDSASYITGSTINVDGGLSMTLHVPHERLLPGRSRSRRWQADAGRDQSPQPGPDRQGNGKSGTVPPLDASTD
jgi:3-oxoacyl-[acyl-carrier protein] reductase